MERKYKYNYNGLIVDVIEAKADDIHDVQISVMGSPDFTDKPFKDFNDPQLEAQGWYLLGSVNGSLNFDEGTNSYANGVEKSMGVVNENDDPTWDKNMGFYHKDGVPYIVKQSVIKSIINDLSVRGALTAAFGLLNNGIRDIGGGNKGEPSYLIFTQKSGRTIVGKKLDNTIVIASFKGVTGLSGLTGEQTVDLAIKLGLRNAVCLDGGGSVFEKYKDTIIIDSPREGVNAVGIYIRLKKGAVITKTLTIGAAVDDRVWIPELGMYVDQSKLI